MATNIFQNVIVDSSGLISLLIDTDQNHQRSIDALSNYGNAPAAIIIPADIFSESMNILGKKFSHEIAVEDGEKILGSTLFRIVEIDNNLRFQALVKLAKQPSSVSFADCVVMALADKFNTKDIFGFDVAFSKNGYQTTA